MRIALTWVWLLACRRGVEPEVDAPPATTTLAVFLGSPSGVPQVDSPPTLVTTLTMHGLPAVGDFDGDAILDLVFCHNEGVSTFIGNGDGTFRSGPETPVASPRLFWGSFVGDVDRDGKLDLIGTEGTSLSGQVTVFRGNGDGTFQPLALAAAGTVRAVADLDGDGNLDLILQRDAGAATSLLGNGDGTFRAIDFVGDASAVAWAAADFDGDGFPDIATVEGAGVATRPGYRHGRGDGTFDPLLVLSPPTDLPIVNDLRVGDFNRDSTADLIASGMVSTGFGDQSMYTGGYIVLLASRPSFVVTTDSVVTGPGLGFSVPGPFVVGDLNKDGNDDIAWGGFGYEVGIGLGHGDGTFATVEYSLPTGLVATQVIATADFDDDGNLDVLAIVDWLVSP